MSIERVIRESGLITAGARLVVAVSGGADSVALLTALRSLAPAMRLRLVVAHMEHGIRGAASRRDAAFVLALARRWRIPVRIGRCRAPLRARRRGTSVEAAAREARYEFLAGVARETKADAMVTAHTADDQAETVIMNMCRGTGVAGLAGIPPEGSWGGVRVARPLLSAGHADLAGFLERRGVKWREDETNTDTRYLRNRIRRQVIPMLAEALNPAVRDALCRLAELCRDDAELVATLARERLGRVLLRDGGLDVAALLQDGAAVQRHVLRRWLALRGVPARAIDRDCIARCERLLRARRASGSVPLCGGGEVRREYGLLRVARDAGPKAGFAARLARPGVTVVDPPGLVAVVEMKPGVVRPPRSRAGDLPAAASISAARVGRRVLVLRSWRAGDRVRPFGMDGTRKVQDVLTDQKVPRAERGVVPVLECGGEIVWVPGYRIARGWEVPGELARAVHIRLERGSKLPS